MSDFHRRIHRGRLHKDMQLPDKIPADHAGTYHRIPVYSDCGIKHPWGRVTLIVKRSIPLAPRPGRSRAPKSSTHRVFVKCPCGREIPAGRYHQHAPACDDAIITNQMAIWERIDGLFRAGRTWPEIARWVGMSESAARYLYDEINKRSEGDRQDIRDDNLFIII